MASSGGRNGAKVVFINTQYVEIDALDFKSVVQNLTGKDSVVPSPPPYSSNKKINKNATNYGAPPRLDASAALVPKFDFDVDHHQQEDHHQHRRLQYSNDYYRPIDIEASVPVQYDTNNNIRIERGGAHGPGSSFLMRDVSFKDIDRLLKLDLPPLDDLHTIFSDNYYS